MAAAAEIQAGTAVINGIQGTITMTGAATFNLASRTHTENFDVQEITAQNGAVVETMVASKRNREIDVEFFPTGANRTAVIAVIASLTALNPLDVITIGQTGTPAVAACAGTWNLMPGMQVRETRDGVLSVTMKLKAHEVAATGDTFAALAVVV